MNDEAPLACDLTTLPSEEREPHAANAERLFTAVEKIREEPDGYRFRLPPEGTVIRSAGTFISQERLCCPFLDFRLEVAGSGAPVWLALTGTEEVKAYLRRTLLSRLEEV